MKSAPTQVLSWKRVTEVNAGLTCFRQVSWLKPHTGHAPCDYVSINVLTVDQLLQLSNNLPSCKTCNSNCSASSKMHFVVYSPLYERFRQSVHAFETPVSDDLRSELLPNMQH